MALPMPGLTFSCQAEDWTHLSVAMLKIPLYRMHNSALCICTVH